MVAKVQQNLWSILQLVLCVTQRSLQVQNVEKLIQPMLSRTEASS
jgi:hypothetical protein